MDSENDHDEKKEEKEMQEEQRREESPSEIAIEVADDGKADESNSTTSPQTPPTTLPNIVSVSSMSIFIQSTLIAIEKSKAAKKNKALKEAVEKAIELNNSAVSIEQVEIDSDFSQLLGPVISALQLACEARNSALTISCLDTFQKLISYDLVDNLIEKEGRISSLYQVVDSICLCSVGSENDEKIQLQIVKALLSAITNTSASIHGDQFLKALRLIVEFRITSKSAIIQNITQTALNQIIDCFFQRMKSSVELLAEMKNSEESEDSKELSVKSAEAYIGDVSLLIQELCQNSEISEDDIKSQLLKTMSLEFLLGIASKYGYVIRSSPLIVLQIKQKLCPALLKHLMSTNVPIFQLSLDVIFALCKTLRGQLKKQLELIFIEVLFPLLEIKSVSFEQKKRILEFLCFICKEKHILIEFFLNYDCDTEALDNLFERIVNTLTRVTQIRSEPNAQLIAEDNQLKKIAMISIYCTLKSLVDWSQKTMSNSENPSAIQSPHSEDVNEQGSQNLIVDSTAVSSINEEIEPSPMAASNLDFASMKQKKKYMQEGVRLFNWKWKKGLVYLLETNCITSKDPKDIALFLINTEGLNKTFIGELIGEGDPESIAIMHAFIESISFKSMDFVTALRTLLQTFRLPGEAQKIDRIMLKFAQRYFVQNEGMCFANADAAYVLAYSVIMLNTDLHNPQVKKRMSKDDFIKNNRGINNNADLDKSFLEAIYDEILNNEIKMNEDHYHKDIKDKIPEFNAVKRKRETSLAVLEDIYSQVLGMLKEIKEDGEYYVAIHIDHVQPMFANTWISLLACISGCLQDYDNEEIVSFCLAAFKYSIRICCQFGLDLERNGFISMLSKYTVTSQVKHKNIEAIKILLEIAYLEGNHLKNSWIDVLRCVSYLDKYQMLADSDDAGDLGSIEEKKKKSNKKKSSTNLAEESTSQGVVIAVDKIFSSTFRLSGAAIVDFVTALASISFEEIVNAGKTANASCRMFSLQKIVEICYYNMNRIRVEWSNIWNVLQEHFNQIGSLSNINVASFAIDSLRQLSMKFLEKEEMPQFSFQKDFLKPFEYIFLNNSSIQIKDMVQRCVAQLIQSKGYNMKSGWQTLLSVFTIGSRDENDILVQFAFDSVKIVSRDYFQLVLENGAFCELIKSIAGFAQNTKFPKLCLQSIDLMKSCSEMLLGNCSHSMKNTCLLQVYSGFCDTLMVADLESRSRAMTYLFDSIKKNGNNFDSMLWESVLHDCIYPIFSYTSDPIQMQTKFKDTVDSSEWISTTFVQGLRSLVELFSCFFSLLEDGNMQNVCDILFQCIVGQDNETISRIGASSLQQILENNCGKLKIKHWEIVIGTIEKLFDHTLPCFDSISLEENSLQVESVEGNSRISMDDLSSNPKVESRRKSKESSSGKEQFQKIILRCVLHLLLLQTINDIFITGKQVYPHASLSHLEAIVKCYQKSFQFAKKFNENMSLRLSIVQKGFMKQLPNLLKQETLSSWSLVLLDSKLYFDERCDEQDKDRIKRRMKGLLYELLCNFNSMDAEAKKRTMSAWKPVMSCVCDLLFDLEDESVQREFIVLLYKEIVEFGMSDLAFEMRDKVKLVLFKIGSIFIK